MQKERSSPLKGSSATLSNKDVPKREIGSAERMEKFPSANEDQVCGLIILPSES
jgi:hypothetical protein